MYINPEWAPRTRVLLAFESAQRVHEDEGASVCICGSEWVFLIPFYICTKKTKNLPFFIFNLLRIFFQKQLSNEPDKLSCVEKSDLL